MKGGISYSKNVYKELCILFEYGMDVLFIPKGRKAK